MTEVYLGLGSNVGSRQAHLAHAIARLRTEARVTGLSSVYETEPVGFTDQPPFLNMVVRLETDRPPEDLLELVRSIEADRERVRTFRNAPRTLDIDLLLYGDRQLSLEGLTVPHPRMNDRTFVLVPLLELAPALTEPGTGRSYRELLSEAGGREGIELVGPGEALKRREAEHDG